MDDLSWLALQLLQPYFYYPLVLSMALFVGVHLAVRFTRIKDHRFRSYLFVMPMLAPLAVYVMYPPQLDIMVMDRAAPIIALPSGLTAFMHMHPGPPTMMQGWNCRAVDGVGR